MTSEFTLFGFHHLISITSIFVISFLFPALVRLINNKSITEIILIILGAVLITHELAKPFYLSLIHI